MSDSPEFTAWIQAHQQRFEAVQAQTRQLLLENLTYAFFYGQKYDAVPFRYEDNSDTPVASDTHYCQADYAQVGDFLEAYTGTQYATYISNDGLACETFAEQAEEMFSEAFYALLQELAHKCPARQNYSEWQAAEDAMDWPYWLQDQIILTQLDWIEQSMVQLKAVSFEWMLKSYRQAAEQQETENHKARELAAEKQLYQATIARRVQRQAQFLLCQPKYNRADYAELQQALQQLAEVVAAEDLRIYLDSSLFRNQVSLSVWDLVQQQFT